MVYWVTAAIWCSHRISINFDYNDVTHLPDWSVQGARGHMDRLIRNYSECGVRRLFYRVSVQGRVSCPLEEMRIYEGYPGWPPSLELLLATGADPLAWFVESCNKYGIEPWAWITIFDSGGDDQLGDPFFQAHPEYFLLHRDGKTLYWGRPCYAYREARMHRVREAVEVASRGVVGILFSLRSHARHPGGNLNTDWGFNPPVVEEYMRRYGDDPRSLELSRTEAGIRFVMLKTEYVTQLMADVRAAIPHIRIMLMVERTVFPEQWSEAKITDPDTAVRLRVVDELCLCGAEPQWIGTAYNDPPIPLTKWVKVYGGDIDTNRAIQAAAREIMTTKPRINSITLHEANRLTTEDKFRTIRDVVETYGWATGAFPPGDTNRDDRVDRSDVQLSIEQFLAGREAGGRPEFDVWPPQPTGRGDGSFDLRDVIEIMRLSLTGP